MIVKYNLFFHYCDAFIFPFIFVKVNEWCLLDSFLHKFRISTKKWYMIIALQNAKSFPLMAGFYCPLGDFFHHSEYFH